MKIRNKITLVFTLITASLLLTIFLFIYYFANLYTENEFYLRLKERANIAAQSFLKEDEFSANIYDEIREKHLHTLPDEEEFIFLDIKIEELTSADSLRQFPPYFFQQIIREEYAEAKNDDTYYVGIPYADNQGDFIVVISAIDKYGHAKMINLRNILVIAFVTSLGFIYIVGLYYAKQVLTPISEITNRANKIRASNLHLRLDTGNKKDELAELAITFNNMLDRLETSFEIQSNFVNNASHELKNPLTAILGEVEVALRKDRPTEEYLQSLHNIEHDAHRLDLLVNSLLRLAQMDYDNKGLIIEGLRVDELLLEVKNDIDNLNPANHITFDFTRLPDQAEALIIQGSESLLKMVLTNVIDNACKFSKNKEVIIKIAASDKAVDIEVKDQGVGIPATELKNIFEPFYRASNARAFKGFGIGLPLSQKIIKIHGGQLLIQANENGGTDVKITLPNYNQHVSIAR